MSAIKLTDRVHWVGVKDPDLKIFDIIMETAHGTTYNSYLVQGEDKIALIDTVKRPFSDEFFANIAEAIGTAKIDYLIVNHTEPDHSGAISLLIEKNPDLKLVCAKAAVPFVKNTLNLEIDLHPVKHGDELDLGGKKLVFQGTPYMHWPDTMMEFLVEDKILFSCDGFAAHYSGETIFADEVDIDLDPEVRYYYDSIMRPYSSFISKHMAKLAELDVAMIAPSHGPIFRENAKASIDTYAEWSADKTEGKQQVAIFYVSAYGNTGKIAEDMAAACKEAELDPVLLDVMEMDVDKARDAIEASLAVMFGTPTFNGDAVKPIWDAVNLISTVHSFGKKAAVFGSYGWSGEGVKLVGERLAGLRLKVFPETYRARLIPSDEDLAEARRYARKFADFVLGAS